MLREVCTCYNESQKWNGHVLKTKQRSHVNYRYWMQNKSDDILVVSHTCKFISPFDLEPSPIPNPMMVRMEIEPWSMRWNHHPRLNTAQFLK